MEAETGHQTITSGQKAVTSRIEIVNALLQGYASCIAQLVQTRLRDVRNLNVAVGKLQQGVAGVLGMRQRLPLKYVWQRLLESQRRRLPYPFGGKLIE